jgi:hypothetical protein
MRKPVHSAGPILVFLSAALIGLFAAKSDALAITFAPTYVPTTVSPVAGAHTDTVVNFALPTGSANFSAVIGFLPDDFGVGACAANSGGTSLAQACADDVIPNGALVGSVVADATLGLINSACNSTTSNPISWSMMDATTDMGTTVTFEDDPGDVDATGEEFEDDDLDGIPNGAEMYPEYLTRLIYGPMVWDVGDPGSAPLQPMLRSYGKTRVADTDVSLQFLLMEPGITINGLPIPATSGYSLITVLQNTGDPGAISTPGAITDSCSPVTSLATTFGVTRNNPATAADEGGTAVLTVPDPGTYEAHALLFSNRDEDNDGVENQMDTCATIANVGNPTIAFSGDVDGDGLDAACDPNDNAFEQDQDGDSFLNRGDNCPLFTNGDNIGPPVNTAQDDVDRDGIGNVCDPFPGVPSTVIAVYPGYPVTLLGTGDVTGPVMGDTNCAVPTVGTVNSVDALHVLRRNASLEPYGACANNAEADVDCSGTITSVDALKILRHTAGLSVTQNEPPPCPDIGTLLP